MSIGYVKKIEIMIMIMISYNILQKRLIFQKYKKCSPGKYAMHAIRSGSIRWISIRFDAAIALFTTIPLFLLTLDLKRYTFYSQLCEAISLDFA